MEISSAYSPAAGGANTSCFLYIMRCCEHKGLNMFWCCSVCLSACVCVCVCVCVCACKGLSLTGEQWLYNVSRLYEQNGTRAREGTDRPRGTDLLVYSASCRNNWDYLLSKHILQDRKYTEIDQWAPMSLKAILYSSSPTPANLHTLYSHT